MTEKIDIVKQLIMDGEYEAAKNLLERGCFEKDEQHKLSLLYRYLHEYDKEAFLVKKALQMYPSWDYMRYRESWHALPIFDPYPNKSKLVPRNPLHLSRNPDTTPSQAILDQLCIVSGADSKYFALLIELIESIKATRMYKDIPINILDGGLTDEEKEILYTFGVAKIKEPEVRISGLRVSRGESIITYKAHLHEYFPEYKFYLWFDADSWIQDETVVDYFITDAARQGVGVTSFLAPKIDKKTGKQYDKTEVATGVYCYDKDSEVLKSWSVAYEAELNNNNFRYSGEEWTLVEIMQRNPIVTSFLPRHFLHRITENAIPFIKGGNRQILYTPIIDKPVPIYAYNRSTSKDIGFWPSKNVEDVEKENWDRHNLLSRQALYLQGQFPNVNLFDDQVFISLRYRDWPKEKICLD